MMTQEQINETQLAYGLDPRLVGKRTIRDDLYQIVKNSNISYEDRITLYRALEKHIDNLV